MTIKESKAIILQSYPMQDADKICVCFTLRFGKVRGVARGAKKLRSRFGASLEPLSEVLLDFYEKEGRELVTIQSCELLQSFFQVESFPQGEAIAHYLVELIDGFTPPHEPNEKIYRLTGAIIDCFRTSVRQWPWLLVYFELWLLKLSGYFPHLELCGKCGREVPLSATVFLSTQGQLSCPSCQLSNAGIILTPLMRREISAILTKAPSQWLRTERDLSRLNPFAEILKGLLRHVLESEIKTARFLQRQQMER